MLNWISEDFFFPSGVFFLLLWISVWKKQHLVFDIYSVRATEILYIPTVASVLRTSCMQLKDMLCYVFLIYFICINCFYCSHLFLLSACNWLWIARLCFRWAIQIKSGWFKDTSHANNVHSQLDDWKQGIHNLYGIWKMPKISLQKNYYNIFKWNLNPPYSKSMHRLANTKS